MPNALVVADDFTGAMDTGHEFAAGGRAVRVSLQDPAEYTPQTATDVLAVDANTRAADPDAAAETVSGLFDHDSGTNETLAYKKIDSTLRGNVVAETDAAIEATGAELAIVAPAFPATDRITVAGQHLVDGVALADAGYDASLSDVRTIFESSRHDSQSLGIGTVVDGPDAVRSALEDSGADAAPTVVVCDATHEHHLRAIAAGADGLESDVLFVGSGGLATAVSVPGTPTEPTVAPSADGGVLGVVGSINERTIEQLAAVPDELVHRLDPAAAVTAPEQTGREAATELVARLRQYGQVVVTGAESTADVERARSAAAEHDVDAGDRVTTALAVATAATEANASVAGLFLTGGSIARAVLDALSVTAIDLTGTAVGDGIPVGRIADGRVADTGVVNTGVVTKAGGFGADGSIVNCLNFLGDTNDSV